MFEGIDIALFATFAIVSPLKVPVSTNVVFTKPSRTSINGIIYI
jgi:hypothetical protein